MPTFLDISAPLSPHLAPWPGDPSLRREWLASHEAGDGMDLSVLTLSLHAGTHADAPSHVRAGAPCVAELPLEPFLGACEVFHLPLRPGTRLLPAHLPGAPRAPRVLFRTDSHPDETRFPQAFCVLSRDLVVHLASLGVRLVGIDTPSVDPLEDLGLEAHQALVDHGLCWLEGLRLGRVDPGLYGLIAPPLRVEGGDGAPVRALLWTPLEGGL